MNSNTLRGTVSPLHAALADIAGALRRVRHAVFLAGTSIRLRYRRSILGPVWVPLTSAAFIFSVSYLYSGFIGSSFSNYLLTLALGYTIWQFINDSIIQGCQTFQQGSEIILSTNIQKFMLVLKTVIMNLFTFALTLPVAILALAVGGIHFSLATWLVIPGLMLIILSGVWSSALLGILCARHRDLGPMVQAAMRVLFFLTPVIWSPDHIPTDSMRRLFVDLNPLSHYIAIWRLPLLGRFPDPLSWAVTSSCTFAGLIVAFMLFAKYRRSIVFWV